MSRCTYIAAALIGAVATVLLLPLNALPGDGELWVSPHGDLAQTLTGHLAFQADAWRWPPLRAANLMWPHGLSIAMTDSNPLVSLLAKLLAGLRGRPTNLLGLWLGACIVLQPVAAVYALCGTGCRSWETALAAAMLAICFPALLFRFEFGHLNLCGHFVVLFALGLALRKVVAGQGAVWHDWVGPCSLLTIASLSVRLCRRPTRGACDRTAARKAAGLGAIRTLVLRGVNPACARFSHAQRNCGRWGKGLRLLLHEPALALVAAEVWPV